MNGHISNVQWTVFSHGSPNNTVHVRAQYMYVYMYCKCSVIRPPMTKNIPERLKYAHLVWCGIISAKRDLMHIL